jgi:hypothetical protein
VKLWPHFSKGDIVLADRAFSSFLALGSLLAQGVDSLMRLHGRRKVDFRKGKSLGHNDQLVLWRRPSPSAVDHHHDKLALLPITILLRQIAFQVQIKGFRTRRIILVTTLLDPVAFPAEALCQLYFQRWNVETHFRELKTLLALDVLRCEAPAMIHKELLVHVIAYNLVRSVMQTAAILHHVDLDRVSFKGTLDTLMRFADAIQAAQDKPRRQAQLLETMFALIAKDLLPVRPARCEPRARKRRPKFFPGLKKPRRQQHPAHPKQALT